MSRNLVKNFSLVLLAQIIVLSISVARAIILPKFLCVEDFGYWEIYWFYTSYVGLFCFGYNDGLYLKYGGRNLEELPIRKIRSANRLLLKILLFFSIISTVLLTIFAYGQPETFSFVFVLLNIPVFCATGISIYVFQITNKFKDYTLYSVADKIIVLLIIIILLIQGLPNYKLIVVADFVGRLLVLSLIIYKLKGIFFGDIESSQETRSFLKENMMIGINLMIANLLGMLLIGGGKMIVQILGDIRDFAIYSFGFSITGLIMTAISAFSVVLYPSVKRISKDRYSILFEEINSFTRLVGSFSFLLYFPCYVFLESFFLKYIEILPFLNIFFLIIYTNIKISVLTNTFFNALRMEKMLLRINVVCVMLFIILGSISFFLIRKIWIIALSTCIILIFRCFYSEYVLSKKLSIQLSNATLGEVIVMVSFIISSLFINLYYGFIWMTVTVMIWVIFNYKKNKALILKFMKR